MPASGRSEAEAARSTREGVGRPERSGWRPTRLGRREAAVAVLWGGLKGAAARAKARDARTAGGSERSERLTRTAATAPSPRGWGFGGVCRGTVDDHGRPSGWGFGGVRVDQSGQKAIVPGRRQYFGRQNRRPHTAGPHARRDTRRVHR
ncbi:hypothetical protein EXE40_13540 [Halorubrum sp. GN11GM_10-3_MGM]|nr:hypothetical protein EXE40_13540 [Halorubrum sp. GN11GM_10-3_MGM]